MDAKSETDACFRALSTTLVLPSFYWNKLIQLGLHTQPGPDSRLHWQLPRGRTRLCGIAAEHIRAREGGLFQDFDVALV